MSNNNNNDPIDPHTVNLFDLWRSEYPKIKIDDFNINKTSEQALIELIYVKTGNEILGDSLENLEQALSVTKRILTNLDGIQQVHNLISVTSKGSFVVNESSFFDDASTHFGEPIFPSLPEDLGNALSRIQQLRASLQGLISELEAVSPAGSADDQNTLLARIQKVYDELPTDSTSLGEWIIDKYDQTTNADTAGAGLVQQNITFAITAAQSLNDSQKENVRRYLFIFEEYYKSASAVLTKISDIIEKMAQNVSR